MSGRTRSAENMRLVATSYVGGERGSLTRRLESLSPPGPASLDTCAPHRPGLTCCRTYSLNSFLAASTILRSCSWAAICPRESPGCLSFLPGPVHQLPAPVPRPPGSPGSSVPHLERQSRALASPSSPRGSVETS